MTADEPTPSPPPVFSDQQRLLLHQLRLLEWQDARAGRSDGTAKMEIAEAEPKVQAPATWQLTRGIDLYPWQQECIDKWLAAGRRGTIKVVTGAGKTLLALAIAERLQNHESLELRLAVVVPTIVLMHQWYDELLQRSNLPPSAIGRLGGGYKEDFSCGRRILITVLASAHKELPRLVKKEGVGSQLLLVADECHRAGAEEMSRIFNTERAFSLGLSATPERDEDEDIPEETGYSDTLLGRELGPIIFDFTLADALRLGIVPRFTIHHYGLPLTPDERTRYDRLSRSISEAQSELRNRSQIARGSGGSFFQWARSVAGRSKGDLGTLAARFIGDVSRRKELLYRMSSRTKAVSKLLQSEFETNPDARVILFHESIAEVMRLFLQLRQEDLPVIAEHSELPGSIREEGLDLFRRGIARVILSARSLIEGFNVPAADVGIVAASSGSVRQRIQTLGRVLRRHRSASGEEKSSHVHVLYAKDTVEEAIYGKIDWDRMTGLERNVYYHWTPGLDPVTQDAPPRQPLPTDVDVAPGDLVPGCEYPGRYEGIELSCDTKLNVKDGEGRYARSASQVAEAVLAVKGTAGRFRITPRKNFVLVRVAEGEEWTTKYVTRLDSPPDVPSEIESEPVNDVSVDTWARNARPGDEYPFPGIPIVEDSLRYKAKRGGVISKRVRGGEIFARVGSKAENPERGEDAALLLQILEQRDNGGDPVSHLLVNEKDHVLYRIAGQLRFLCALRSGLEFPE